MKEQPGNCKVPYSKSGNMGKHSGWKAASFGWLFEKICVKGDEGAHFTQRDVNDDCRSERAGEAALSSPERTAVNEKPNKIMRHARRLLDSGFNKPMGMQDNQKAESDLSVSLEIVRHFILASTQRSCL